MSFWSDFWGAPTASQRVVKLLSLTSRPLTGKEIADITSIGAGTVYVLLARLESKDQISSETVPGTYPQRRVYRILAP